MSNDQPSDGISVGIDLGTSNSVVAVMRDGEPKVLADDQGHRIQPSVVAFGYGSAAVVGQRARQQLTYAPENTVFSAKRLIGRRYGSEEVERMKRLVAWGITEGPHGDARIRVQGRVFAVPEVSARVLQHMKQLAESATGSKVAGAVITVPAYFNDHQRQATRDAANIAGLKCLRIINEPTAAALAYGFGRETRQHVAVYDLGGGTFDMTVLRMEPGMYEVLSTAGDTFLGGDDFDASIAMWLREAVERESGVELAGNHAALTKLNDAAERAKVALSALDAVDIRVPNLIRGQDGQSVQVHTRLDRHTATNLVMPLIQRTFVVVDDAMAQAGLSTSQIDAVLLVGGMTRFPSVKEAVASYFGKEPVASINPDEVIAVGAAIQANTLTAGFDPDAAVLLDVTPQTLGVGTVGGFVEPIIPRNTAIPTERSKVFHTAHDNQTQVRIKVYQGESRLQQDNELLGHFVLDGLRPAPRGEVRIKVTFAIDADGIVQVAAVDEDSGRVQEITIEASSGLTKEEVKGMRFDELGF
ncbi:MAG: Hsp70 family protein [Alphaproteobacteria bacterium]|nr:Hsp70 family protein [Alphaproteobacteria bacterium]